MPSLFLHRTPPGGRRPLAVSWICLFALSMIASLAPASLAVSAAPVEGKKAARDLAELFHEELQKAADRLKWRGERLTDDSLYATVLTGLSWESAWGKEHLFWLAWGDCRKRAGAPKRRGRDPVAQVELVQRAYASQQYRRAVELAFANFSQEEIGCDIALKIAVGNSLLALNQPERAFPVFASPFELPRTASKELGNGTEWNRQVRESAFDAAQRAGLKKEAIAFALSLLLEPASDRPVVDKTALYYLEASGVELDRVLLGILQAPDHLRGLPNYYYAAADLLAIRATPRLLPFLLHLVTSNDVYLRSRALLGLGIIGYQARPGDIAGWEAGIVTTPPHEFGISASERKLIDQEIHDAARSDKYRLRAAAALALTLVGEDDSLAQLQQLASDRAYIQSAPGSISEPNGSKLQRVVFPVRIAAAAGLARYGRHVKTGGGDLGGKALEAARRGGQDVTNDHRNLRRDVASVLSISPADVLNVPLLDTPHR